MFTRASSTSSRKTKTRSRRAIPACQATSTAAANTGHVKMTLQAHASWPSPVATSDELLSLYLPTVPWTFTQCPCSTSLCDPVNSILAVHQPLPTPPSPLNHRPTNYLPLHTMDSADAIPEPVWNALDQLARVPKWMWAAGVVVGLFGIIVLVFPFPVYLIMLNSRLKKIHND